MLNLCPFDDRYLTGMQVVQKGQTLVLMPNREEVSVSALYGETEDEIQIASCGEQIRLRLR
jgi:peptide chain release factor subunit 3